MSDIPGIDLTAETGIRERARRYDAVIRELCAAHGLLDPEWVPVGEGAEFVPVVFHRFPVVLLLRVTPVVPTADVREVVEVLNVLLNAEWSVTVAYR